MRIEQRFGIAGTQYYHGDVFATRKEAQQYILREQELKKSNSEKKDSNSALPLFCEDTDKLYVREGCSIVADNEMELNLINGILDGTDNFFVAYYDGAETPEALAKKKQMEDIMKFLKDAKEGEGVFVSEWESINAVGKVKKVFDDRIVLSEAVVTDICRPTMCDASESIGAKDLVVYYRDLYDLHAADYDAARKQSDFEQKYDRIASLSEVLKVSADDITPECFNILKRGGDMYGMYFLRFKCNNQIYIVMNEEEKDLFETMTDEEYCIALKDDWSVEKTFIPDWDCGVNCGDFNIYKIA